MTDREFLLKVLGDYQPHTLNEILSLSLAERGCGLTVHSRAADLRRDGYLISNKALGGRRRGSVYRLEGRKPCSAPGITATASA